MKITYVVSGINRSVFFEHTALELAKRGYILDFILIGTHNNEFADFLKKNNLPFINIVAKSWRQFPAYIRQVKQLLQQSKPDIVHTHLVTANTIGLVAAKRAGISKRIFTRHSGLRPKNDWKTWIFDRITHWASTSAIANTATTKNIMVKLNYDPAKIEVIHYGFDIDRLQHPNEGEVKKLMAKYNPAGKRPVIGMISRPVEWKGVQYAIPAFKKLLADYPDALLCLFNYSENDEMSAQLNKQLEELPAGSYLKVHFESNVYDLYNIFDLFVHIPVSETFEAFGQVYVEALATGTPSVLTLSGIANDFVVHKEHAYVVDYRNIEQTYTGMKTLLADKALATAMAEKGKAYVKEHFSVPRYITKLEKFYHQPGI